MIALRTRPSLSPSAFDLVLIHAFPVTGEMYSTAAKELQQIAPAVTVHLVDLPGFGDAPYQQRWTLAEAMRSLHEELKKRGAVAPVVGGTSMGGYAALAYYRLYPDEVTGLILSNTKAAGDDEQGKQNREIVAQDVEKRGHEAVYERMFAKLVSSGSREHDPGLNDRLRALIASTEPRSIAAASRALGLREDSTDLLHDIEVPALIITGETDELIPPSESKKLLAIRNSHMEVIDGTAHLSAMEAPRRWAEVVASFLQTLAASPL